MEKTKSADGTTIAFDRTGAGPPLVIIGGAFNTRRSGIDLVPLLASSFTVITYDRRGRGDSSDTAPYAVEREVEDLAALADALGSGVMLYGHSSGGALALEAAAAGMDVVKVAAYEPPYRAPGELPPPADYAARVQAAADAGDRESIARIFFLEAVGLPPEVYDSMRSAAHWPDMLAVAHTIPYENAVVGDGAIPVDRLRRISVPTLIVAGGSSPVGARASADSVARVIPRSERLTLADQEHVPAAAAIAPVLVDFFERTASATERIGRRSASEARQP